MNSPGRVLQSAIVALQKSTQLRETFNGSKIKLTNCSSQGQLAPTGGLTRVKCLYRFVTDSPLKEARSQHQSFPSVSIYICARANGNLARVRTRITHTHAHTKPKASALSLWHIHNPDTHTRTIPPSNPAPHFKCTLPYCPLNHKIEECVCVCVILWLSGEVKEVHAAGTSNKNAAVNFCFFFSKQLLSTAFEWQNTTQKNLNNVMVFTLKCYFNTAL